LKQAITGYKSQNKWQNKGFMASGSNYIPLTGILDNSDTHFPEGGYDKEPGKGF
jgi:hypothetical protein